MQATTNDAKSRLVTFSLPAFSLQNICRASSACRFCAASLYSGFISEIALSGEKAKVEENTAIKTRKPIRLKLLLLSPSLQRQCDQPAGWLLGLAGLVTFMTFRLLGRARVHSPAPASIIPGACGNRAGNYHEE